MNNAISFDTLAYAKKLIAVGVPEKQAEVQAEALLEMVDEHLATKRDLKEMEYKITAGIVKWVAGMLVAQAAIIAALVKLL